MILVLDIVAPVTAIMRPEQKERILKIVSVNFIIALVGLYNGPDNWTGKLE